MRLHFRPGRAEQLLGALERNGLDHVDVLAAAVVALAGVALGVLVGELGAVRDQHGWADVVLGGDQLDVVVLPAVLELHCVPDFRVGLREEVGGEHGSGAKAPMLLSLLALEAKAQHMIAVRGHTTSQTMTAAALPRSFIGYSGRQRARSSGASESTVCCVVRTCSGLATATRRAATFTVSPNTSAPSMMTGP